MYNGVVCVCAKRACIQMQVYKYVNMKQFLHVCTLVSSICGAQRVSMGKCKRCVINYLLTYSRTTCKNNRKSQKSTKKQSKIKCKQQARKQTNRQTNKQSYLQYIHVQRQTETAFSTGQSGKARLVIRLTGTLLAYVLLNGELLHLNRNIACQPGLVLEVNILACDKFQFDRLFV